MKTKEELELELLELREQYTSLETNSKTREKELLGEVDSLRRTNTKLYSKVVVEHEDKEELKPDTKTRTSGDIFNALIGKKLGGK